MQLQGLALTVTHGAGRNNGAALAATYPNSALVVAVYAVGQLDAINDGRWDENITTLIETLKAHRRPVYLRFGDGFDGDWNAYEPAPFKAAWTRIHRRIAALGAERNIAMVWQSASYCAGGDVATHGGHPLDAWYPGDDRVDWVGVSYFTPGAAAARLGGTCTVADQAIDRVADFAAAHAKPLMVAEAAPQGYATAKRTWRDTDGRNPTPPVAVPASVIVAWYTRLFEWVEARNVRAVAYINAHWDRQPMWASPYAQGYWGDSRVQADPGIRAAWLSRVASGYLKASPGLFTALG